MGRKAESEQTRSYIPVAFESTQRERGKRMPKTTGKARHLTKGIKFGMRSRKHKTRSRKRPSSADDHKTTQETRHGTRTTEVHFKTKEYMYLYRARNISESGREDGSY